MTPEEQQAFVDVVTGGLTEQEIEYLENRLEVAQFEADVYRVHAQLVKATDFLAEKTDIYVVAAALEMLSEEYDNATGESDEA